MIDNHEGKNGIITRTFEDINIQYKTRNLTYAINTMAVEYFRSNLDLIRNECKNQSISYLEKNLNRTIEWKRTEIKLGK